jgi:hypothetical protein
VKTQKGKIDVIHRSVRSDVVIATVQSIVRNHGPYVVATAPGISGTITFSLGRDAGVWQEEAWPEHGVKVVLGDLRKKVGWRAYEARFLRPGDEETK